MNARKIGGDAMKKISLILVALVLFLIPFGSSAFAYEGGLLNTKTGVFVDQSSGSAFTSYANVTTLTDNDTKTTAIIRPIASGTNNSVMWTLGNASTINSYYQNSGYGNSLTIKFYDINKNLISSVTPLVSSNVTSFTPINNVKYVQLANHSGGTATVLEFDVFGSVHSVKHDEISNLTYTKTHNTVDLDFVIPSSNPDYTGSKVYRDGALLATLDANTSHYTDSTASPSKTYNYKVTGVYSDGYETSGITKTITTPETPPEPEPEPEPEPITEVTNVNVKPFHNRVNLSWDLPTVEGFHHVNIYRDEVVKKGFFSSLIGGTKVYAAETPIFETNGTYFNDLNVQPETKYEYTLKTQSVDGLESEGVTVQTKTLGEPAPKLEGGGYTKDEDGDYLYTWTSPTEGTVKIIVGGQEYKTVQASDKQILIPKEQMKYDFLGNPNVKLVPISITGKEGSSTKPGENGGIDGVDLPFGATDLLKSIMSLLMVVGPFVLLGLAIMFFKPIKNLIVREVQKRNERSMER